MTPLNNSLSPINPKQPAIKSGPQDQKGKIRDIRSDNPQKSVHPSPLSNDKKTDFLSVLSKQDALNSHEKILDSFAQQNQNKEKVSKQDNQRSIQGFMTESSQLI